MSLLSRTSPSSKKVILDPALDAFGFEFEDISPHKVSGRLHLTQKCCQPFKVLHGGVSALIAETLASMGAHMTNNYKRVAGIQLTINHLKPAHLGDHVFAEATPIDLGKTIQVWEVCLWKTDPINQEKQSLIATSKVTLFCNMPVPESAKDAEYNLRKYAKL